MQREELQAWLDAMNLIVDARTADGKRIEFVHDLRQDEASGTWIYTCDALCDVGLRAMDGDKVLVYHDLITDTGEASAVEEDTLPGHFAKLKIYLYEDKLYETQAKMIAEEYGQEAADRANYGQAVVVTDELTDISTKIYVDGGAYLRSVRNHSTGEIKHEWN